MFPPFSARSRSLIASSFLSVIVLVHELASATEGSREREKPKKGRSGTCSGRRRRVQCGKQGLVNFKRSTRSRLCSSTSSSVCCCCAGSRVFPFSTGREFDDLRFGVLIALITAPTDLNLSLDFFEVNSMQQTHSILVNCSFAVGRNFNLLKTNSTY